MTHLDLEIKKNIVGGILFDRLADEFISTSENQGYNILIGVTVDNSTVLSDTTIIGVVKGDDGIGVPPGGLITQVLSKKSNSDYDTE